MKNHYLSNSSAFSIWQIKQLFKTLKFSLKFNRTLEKRAAAIKYTTCLQLRMFLTLIG